MKYDVSPLTCGRCVAAITDALRAIDPSARVAVDLLAGTVDAEGQFDEQLVVSTLAGIGYTAVPATWQVPTGTPAGTCCGTCKV